MISSDDVAALLSQQQGMMMANTQYVQMNNGLGAYSSAYIPPPMNLPLVNPIALPQMQFPMHGAHSGFNYGGTPYGYGMGNQAAQMGVGAMGGAYNMATLGVTGMGMYGGFKMGGLGGMVRGGLMAGGLPMLAGGLAAGYAANQMSIGLQEQHGIYSTLGSNFNFINPGSRTGRGFSRTDAKAISDVTREMGALPEMLTSMGELNRIMNSISQMGVMQGLRNAQDFNRKFKESIGVLQDMAKIMQTSMEGATKFFGEANQAGFYSGRAMKMNAAQRQFTSGMTGMDQDQIHQLQLNGSLASYGMGGTRAGGANLALRTARQIGSANAAGILSNDEIQELTGEMGAAGIKSMSEMLTGASYRMSRSSVGTALALAVGKQVNGRYTGEMDENLAEQVRSGGMSMSEMMRLAHKKAASRGAKLSFAAQRDKMLAETANGLGVEGISMELQNILGSHGWDNPDAQNLVMQRFGLDERQANAVMTMMNKLPEIQRDISGKGRIEGRRMAEQSYYNQNLSGEAIKRKIGKRWENLIEEPLRKLGADIGNDIEKYIDTFMDDLLGRHSVEISKSYSNQMVSAMSGNKGAQENIMKDLKGMNMGASFGATRGAVDYGLELLSGHTTENRAQFGFLNSLPAGLKKETILGISQTSDQAQRTRSLLRQFQNGVFGKDSIKRIQDNLSDSQLFGGNTVGELMDIKEKEVRDLIRSNNSHLMGMSETEKLNYLSNKTGLDLESLAYFQSHSGSANKLGAIDFNGLANERYSLGNLGNAEQLANVLKGSREGLAGRFKNKSGVEALLSTDSKSRDLFLSALKGNSEAVSLLEDRMGDAKRDQLLNKFGIKEGDLGGLRELFGGRGDLGNSVGSFEAALRKSSLGGEITQMRRTGLGMQNRLGGTSKAVQNVLGGFVGSLAGLEGSNLEQYLSGADSNIHSVLDKVEGLTGKDKEQALSVLGSLGKGALNYSKAIEGRVGTKRGLEKFYSGADEDTRKYIDSLQSDGNFSKDDRKNLGKYIRDRVFKQGLASEGTVMGKDIPGAAKNEELLNSTAKNLKDVSDNLKSYLQLNNSFAQMIINSNPELKGDATVVNNMRQATEQLPKKQ